MPSTLPEILESVESSAIRLVRFLYCDTSSIIRGKVTAAHRLKSRIESGIGLVKGMMSMNLLDLMQTDTGYGATGEVRLVPDLSTFVILPYSAQSAAMICDLEELDRSPWQLCPRSVLKAQIEQARQLGVEIQAAFEPEFMLGSEGEGGFVPIDRSLCFSTDGMNRAGHFINSFVDALDRQGISVEQYYPELGHGQHELSIRHSPALQAADQHIWYRETLRGVAFNEGLQASLAPKPFADQAGNGCHLHLSAWDANSHENLLYGENGLSEFAHHFIAGLLTNLPALVALTCASVNSYRRLQPRSWSSAFVCWGYENREAAVRVPTTYWGDEKNTTNLELKCVDASGNPYLALAGAIACGLDGVRRKLLPPAPIAFDPGTLSASELQNAGIRRLPDTLGEALAELVKNDLLRQVLGEELLKTYEIVKRSEWITFSEKETEFELKHHRYKF
jgi:glutamine synthetase